MTHSCRVIKVFEQRGRIERQKGATAKWEKQSNIMCQYLCSRIEKCYGSIRNELKTRKSSPTTVDLTWCSQYEHSCPSVNIHHIPEMQLKHIHHSHSLLVVFNCLHSRNFSKICLKYLSIHYRRFTALCHLILLRLLLLSSHINTEAPFRPDPTSETGLLQLSPRSAHTPLCCVHRALLHAAIISSVDACEGQQNTEPEHNAEDPSKK